MSTKKNADFKANDPVTVTWSDGAEYHGEIVRVFKNGKLRVKTSDGDAATLTPDKVKPRDKSRKAKSEMTDAQRRAAVATLLEELAACTERAERIPVRRKLRRLGHYGGLQETLTLEQHLERRSGKDGE